MATINVPALMRDLTGGASEVEGRGERLWDVLHDVDRRYPGFMGRLVVGRELNPVWIAVVDGRPAPLGLRARVCEESRIRFVPALGGG